MVLDHPAEEAARHKKESVQTAAHTIFFMVRKQRMSMSASIVISLAQKARESLCYSGLIVCGALAKREICFKILRGRKLILALTTIELDCKKTWKCVKPDVYCSKRVD